MTAERMRPLAFITGASSGIGQAMALHFYEEGYDLALVARRGEVVAAWAAAKGITAERLLIHDANVADIDSIVAAAELCLARLGVPNIVIASAGVGPGMDTAERADLDVMSRVFATNNIGLAATFHPFIAAMRERGSGTFVAIASVASVRGLPGHGAYCASKAAVVAYCESLRGEVQRDGLRVVTLCPGYIDTPMTKDNAYPMPFLMPVDAFAKQAYRAIMTGDSYRIIPWQMGIVARIFRALPNRLFDRLLQNRARKGRA